LSDESLTQEPGSAETPDEEPNNTEEAELRSKVFELEDLVVQKEEELSQANAHLSQLEEMIAERDEKLAQAASSYKALVIESNPGVLEELITGDTIDDINVSLEKATSIVGKVRQGLEAEVASARVPAGAPERMPTDLSGLSPREKIQYGIGGKR